MSSRARASSQPKKIPTRKPESGPGLTQNLEEAAESKGQATRGDRRGTGRGKRAARAGALRDPARHRRPGSNAGAGPRLSPRAGTPPDRGRARPREDADD